ncbi:TonB-dependent receptor [Tenacibaculum sp. UWU-22]|uniref:TonB-dependent receptor n=1 Tax=Tenacibaculum sp. UWU-22 TaxID=3234187 RepID=UPI0034DB5DC5
MMYILCCIGYSAIYSQNTLKGKITDTDNNPLLGVEIYAPYIHKGGTTDEKGGYELKNIPNGQVTINVTYLGFKTITKKLNFNNKDIVLDFKLEESVFTMDEVIVSTPFNKLQSQNVVKVIRLSARSLQKMGVPTLAEGLTNIPGVSQVTTGQGIGKPVIRGLSGNRVVVYAQGVRLENQQFGSEHGLGVSDTGIESVEVIKGPASLLYGSDALGGVLYINPEKFASENEQKILVNQRFFSNTIGSNSSVGIKASGDVWKFLARATYAFHSDYKIPTQQRVTNTRFKEKDIKFGVGFNKTNFASEFRYNFNNSKIGLTDGIGEQTITTNIELPYQDIDNQIFSLHNHLFFENSKLDFDFGYTLNNRKEFEEPDNIQQENNEVNTASLSMKLATFSYDAKYHFPKFNKIETILGVQGMHQTNTNFGEEILIPNAKINDFGLFTTADYNWQNKTIQAGVRFDNRSINTEYHEVISDNNDKRIFNKIDKSFKSITASVGLKATLFKKIQTRLNLASGFRAPNLAELTSNGIHEGTNRFEIGNANLKTEKSTQADVSFEYEVEHFEVFANGFYNRLNDYIYISPTQTYIEGKPAYQYQQNDAKLYGGEFGFHLHPHPLDWLHLESTFEMVVGKQDNGNYLPLIPANTWKNTLRTEFDFNHWLQQGYASISLHSTFAQNKISEFETKTAGYNLVNVGVGGDLILGKIKLNTTISVDNLFDKKYINHLSRLKQDGILNAGRNLVVGVRFLL